MCLADDAPCLAGLESGRDRDVLGGDADAAAAAATGSSVGLVG